MNFTFMCASENTTENTSSGLPTTLFLPWLDFFSGQTVAWTNVYA